MESHSAEGMPATTHRLEADRKTLPPLSRDPVLQAREHHYRKGSQTRGRPKEEGEKGREGAVRCQLAVAVRCKWI